MSDDANAQNDTLTHVDERGEVVMVDVAGKPSTLRVAVASARVLLGEKARSMVEQGSVAKGDVLATARISGIMAAKRTSDIIPLCHPLQLTSVKVKIDLVAEGLDISCRAETVGSTGVEMEALTGASAAALTVYDMLKAVERGITISEVKLLEKRGGRSGHWQRA